MSQLLNLLSQLIKYQKSLVMDQDFLFLFILQSYLLFKIFNQRLFSSLLKGRPFAKYEKIKIKNYFSPTILLLTKN